MHAWESIQKAINYIEDNIKDKIELAHLANIANLSYFYFHRLFTRLAKTSAQEYIKLRRLARSCESLKNKDIRILDIALEHGFSSHETFTRAFKDIYGLTPSEYRDNPVSLNNFDKPDLLLNYIVVDEGVPLISDGLVLEMNRKALDEPVRFLGIQEHMPFKPGKMLGERPGISVPDTIWKRLFQSVGDIPRIPDGRTLGVCFKGDAPEGYTTYFAGVESQKVTANDNFASWLLPAREYVVCSFESENFGKMAGSAVGKAMKYTRFWLKKHGLIADGFFPEMYYRGSPEMVYMELWIPFKKR